MKKQLLILISLLTTVIGYSQTFTDPITFIEFTVIPATTNVEITGYDFTNGGLDVNIPSTVTNNSTTYNVTEIGDEAFLAFNSTEKITSVIIPTGITNISYRSFQGNLLTSVIIPDTVTEIGSLAFAENPQLANVVLSDNIQVLSQAVFQSCDLSNISIPNSVTVIKSNAFWNNNLTSVTIPSNVTSVEARAFMGNPLTCVISENTTPPIIAMAVGGNTTLDTFGGSRPNIDLSIPTGTANAYTAAQWTGFNSVAEGLSGTFVVDHITYQILPNTTNEVTITSYNVAGGTVVNIPATVTNSCANYTVTEIGTLAFNGRGLTSVTIPNGVVSIHIGAFLQNSLTSIVFPDSVTFIGNLSFKTNQIANVVIPSNAYAGHESFMDNALINVTFEDGVTTIGPSAFRDNQISNLTIPSSVANIYSLAFAGNPLTSVTSLGLIPPSIITGTDDTFGSTANRANIDLYIPTGTEGPYVTNTGALWTNFKSVTLSATNFEIENEVILINGKNHLEIISPEATKLENYTIYNISGSEVKKGNEAIISTEILSNGLYLIELNFNKGRLIKKFAK